MIVQDPPIKQQSPPAAIRWLRSRRGEAILTTLALAALALAAIHPLMFGSLPRTDDALQHLHRLIALDYSIRYGDLWPRYSPTLLYGYGEPIFNYYSPLSLYPFEALHLAGLSFQSALIVGLVGYILLGMVGAYLLGRSWGGPLAGIGTAAGFTYAPYIIYNILERGGVGEVAALALLPWVLWIYRRLALRGRRIDFALALVLTTLMLLTHNITALQTGALLAVYGLFVWWTGPHPPRFLVQMGLAGIMAVGVTTFYWLPALGETSYVHMERTRVGVQNPPDAPEFDDQFQPLSETFGLPQPADLTWFNPPTHRSLSWPQIALGLAGLGLLAFRRSGDRKTRMLRGLMILLLVLIALMVFMTTAASGWVWATVPLLQYFQFPWRVLGPASLLLALAAGIGMAQVAVRIGPAIGRGAWAAAGLTVIVVYAMPWLYNLYIPDPAASSVIDTHKFERETGQLGGTARGEFAPTWAEELPDPDRLDPLYAQDEVISRLQPNTAITVKHVTWGPTSASLSITAPDEERLVFDWLYFPGWWAKIDGQPAALKPTPKRGLISLTVPPGDHDLALGFGPTPLRTSALIVSGVCAALALLLIGAVHHLWREPAPAQPDAPGERRLLPALVPALLAGLAIFALKVALIDNIQSPIKRSRFAGGLEAGLQYPLRMVFDGQVTLLGIDQPTAQVESGQTAHLVLYWQPTENIIPDDYTSTLTLSDPAGNPVAESGEFYPGGWATSNWVPGFYVRQQLDLTVPPGTPPGSYSLSVSLFSPERRLSLQASAPDGAPLGSLPAIATLEVTRPARPASSADLAVGQEESLPLIENRLIPELTLLSASSPPASAAVGESLTMLAVWRAEAHISQAYGYSLVWLNPDGKVAAISAPAPPVPSYATDQWQQSDVWRGLARFYVPGKLDAGAYNVAIQLFDGAGQMVGGQAVIGVMVVTTPPRTYTLPHPNATSDMTWENGITLIGYDLPQATVLRGGTLPLTLYWTPRSEISTSLTLFVHLVSTDGQIMGQVDTIPAHATRPTPGWAPREVITDAIELPVKEEAPAGRYFLRVGWYDPATGARVTVNSGEFWLLPDIIRVMSGE